MSLTVTTEVLRGNFPQWVLAPINFDALYAQQQEEEKQRAGAAPIAEKTH